MRISPKKAAILMVTDAGDGRCSAQAKSTGERCRRRATRGFPVCQVHGSGSPRKGKPGGRPIVHGRYSKYLPDRLAARYLEAQADVRLLELRDEIGLVDARIAELLERLSSGESGQGWREVQAAYAGLKATIGTQGVPGDAGSFQAALAALGDVIGRGNRDHQVWEEILALVDQRRRLVESERKRHVEMQQMITAERAMILLAAITSIIKEHVHEHTTLAAISRGIRALVADDAGTELIAEFKPADD